MEIEILNSQKNELEFRIVGEDDTFANLLRKILHEDNHVSFAAYRIIHPLTERDKPIFKLVTDGKESPVEALTKAGKKTKTLAKKFRKDLIDKV
ncbi:MAG: DNA-directed RNA polymerase subunit L [Methanomicrobia archaeon]|nr:DNA-directed RNA polymerase subunit L [Methanomicrobia archaeon]MCK4309990.1 DNA-directed RNA polymerase subunit L [Methanomicrobia archaeon]MCK4433250.1 DNA-directed RNA polymerase subunit L [Methanomicrobia archaeon]MCK4636445.1 DNA-directed RNA polymerase subunit L [Methanomicrobia archaeon]